MAEFVEGPALAALSCGKPVYLVVLLPGAGMDERILLDLALGWAPSMPKADFLVASGRVGESGADARTENAAATLDRFLDDMLARRRLLDSHLALVGFSEGASLALYVGLRRAKKIAAIVALSASTYDFDLLAGANGAFPPTLLVHGEADALCAYASMQACKEALKERDAPVWSFKRPGLGHELDDDGVAAAGEFLARHVVHTAPAGHDHAHS